MIIIAHGGYSAKFEENTSKSYLEAAKLQPHFIEMDITKIYNNIYFYHPPKNFETDGSHLDNLEIPDNRLFETIITTLKPNIVGSKLYLDIKNTEADDITTIVKKVIDLRLSLDGFMFGARTLEIAEELIKLGVNNIIALPNNHNNINQWNMLGVDYYRIWEDQLSSGLIETVKSTSMKLIVTTGSKSLKTAGYITNERLQKLKKIGVDGVIINDLSIARNLGYI